MPFLYLLSIYAKGECFCDMNLDPLPRGIILLDLVLLDTSLSLNIDRKHFTLCAGLIEKCAVLNVKMYSVEI